MGISERFCKDCGKDISDRHLKCTRCILCQRNYKLSIRAKNMENKRKNRASRRLTELGTSDFGCHRIDDFEKEAEAVSRELKKLRLRKK